MSHEELPLAIEQQLFDRDLNFCERYILEKSWYGERYTKIALETGYDRNYIKQIGAKLWSELSKATGKNVTKKNLRIVFGDRKNIASKPDKVRSGLTLVNVSPSRISNANSQRNKSSIISRGRTKGLHACSVPVSLAHDLSLSSAENSEANASGAEFNSNDLSFPSTPLRSNSPLYINRPPIEDIAYTEIEYPGCLLRINGARKTGKSSLLNQILAHGSAKNFKSIVIDLQEAELDLFSDLDRFLQWFCASISRQLGLSVELEKYWQIGIGSKINCKIYLEYLLEKLDRPLILAINEINRLFRYPDLMQDFLSTIRFWHEQSKSNVLWQKLRLILVHSTNIYVPLDFDRSALNIGLSLRPPSFDFKQTAMLAQRYGLDIKQPKEHDYLVQLYEMVNGHPYLTSLAFYYLQNKIVSFPELIRTAPTPKGIFHNHLLSLLLTLRSDLELAKVFQKLITNQDETFVDAIATHKLEALGLIEYSWGYTKPICQLYALYFQEQLSQL